MRHYTYNHFVLMIMMGDMLLSLCSLINTLGGNQKYDTDANADLTVLRSLALIIITNKAFYKNF